MKTRYSKIIGDITNDYAKNIMLVVAIAIGLFGIGTILGSYSVLNREMRDNYLGTVPASATLVVDKYLSKDIIDSIKDMSGVLAAERHATIRANMKVGDKWYPLMLFVIDDFESKQTNKFTPVSGSRAPATECMVVERTSYVVMQASEGDDLLVKIAEGEPRKIKISGTVHDPSLAPAWQEQAGYGYITLSTLQLLHGQDGFNQLRLLVDDQNSREAIAKIASEVADGLHVRGYNVLEIQIPSPGKHPHQSQMSSVMWIFIIFSYILLLLASILVATSMATIMVKQVRQIGVMKTIGASTRQIASLYLLMMLVLCAISITIAIPLGNVAATAFTNQIAVLLNIEIRNSNIPWFVPLLQAGSGIFIPCLVAAFPVIRGSRISIRKALDNYGVSQHIAPWVATLTHSRFFTTSFSLAIRNVFRQRSRLVTTVGLLAAGGAMFMTALNVSEAWNTNLKRIYSQRLYDLELRLTDPDEVARATAMIEELPGVTAVETLTQTSTSFEDDHDYKVTHTYPDQGHGSFSIQAVPLPTRSLNLTITEGRWLTPMDSNAVVLNQIATGFVKQVKLNDIISLSVDGKTTEWRVVGFSQDVGTPATAYVPLDAFKRRINVKANIIQIIYNDRSKNNAARMNTIVEQLMEREHITLVSSIPVWLLHNAVAAHMKVLINSLMAMAILMAFVGTLGLASTMSMSIMERTREIGVMRAIGATPRKIENMLFKEGAVIGGISFVIAIVLSLPVSLTMGKLVGSMAFRTPLSLTISLTAIIVWIAVVLLSSYAATRYPARRAVRLTTREALAYE
jgi:putative ABC transport system permease protein